VSLFERLPADTLVRFLAEAARPRDLWAVMSALPAGPFLAESLRLLGRRAWVL
jgi:hypothetical protein